MSSDFNLFNQNELANKFHSLHHNNEMLVLPNAWDCSSAKIFEVNAFPAIATTSCGLSWACGYQDGEYIPSDLMVQIIRGITRVVKIPVSADIEGGFYRDNLELYSKFINDLIDAGVIGINLEDSNSRTNTLVDTKEQRKFLKIAKEIALQKGVNLFVNARVDGMILENESLEYRISTCIERANLYKEAGVDGIFVPFIRDIETVAKIKEDIKLPLNIMITNTLNISELRKLKVERVSIGGRAMLATLSLLNNIANDIKNSNDWSSLFTTAPTYETLNSWF
ncbi:MAG TPA: isocitrate lyase/phosphoenolpyruvate mutase family protein [Candidatus Kapabacteria bacterium]|nr:isocitrate lyase/phosphoenolpyruvate mutase family protein [Candidatus Kapabacteria bacterium]